MNKAVSHINIVQRVLYEKLVPSYLYITSVTRTGVMYFNYKINLIVICYSY